VKSIRSRQLGAALIVSLIMLVLITLLAVVSFRLAKNDLQIAGNMQQRGQAFAAAQAALEQVISTTQFTITPANALPRPCLGVPNTSCFDVNGDGVTDVKVVITPACVSVQLVPVTALDFNDPNDAGCLVGTAQDFGVAGAANNSSLCASTLWDTQAIATDVISNAQYVVNQGTAVRVPATTICP
jgi:hypothetical protein